MGLILGRTLRGIRSLRDGSRNSLSRLMRTRRTRRECLSWQPSYSRRSRLTRRRLRRGLSLLRLSFVIRKKLYTLTLLIGTGIILCIIGHWCKNHTFYHGSESVQSTLNSSQFQPLHPCKQEKTKKTKTYL